MFFRWAELGSSETIITNFYWFMFLFLALSLARWLRILKQKLSKIQSQLPIIPQSTQTNKCYLLYPHILITRGKRVLLWLTRSKYSQGTKTMLTWYTQFLFLFLIVPHNNYQHTHYCCNASSSLCISSRVL